MMCFLEPHFHSSKGAFISKSTVGTSGTRVGLAIAHDGDGINPIDPRTIRNELLHHFWTELPRHPRETFSLTPSHRWPRPESCALPEAVGGT